MISLLKRILDASGKYKKRITVAFVFSFLKALLMKAPVGLAFIAIDAFLNNTMSGALCLKIGIVLVMCVALQAVFDVVADRLQAAAGFELFADKRMELGKHLRAMPMGYLAAQGLVILLVPILPPVLNILFTGIIMFSTKLIPGGMMCWFLFSTTTVSEFIAVMDRMHVTKKISVPISVMFRFFPTIKEEYGYVQKAMRMREVGSLRNPIKMLEYRMVPFLMSVVSIGNDLSASALTRGLNAPCPRTNMCRIGFTWRDAVTFLAFLLFFSGYFAVLFLQRSVR